jgi:hypothetical protein
MKASKVLNLFSYIALVILLISSVNKVTATSPYTDTQGVVYTYSGSTASVTGFASSLSSSVTIPSTITDGVFTYNVTSIGANAFQSCTILSSVTIPNSVTSIGDLAFYGCTNLSSVTMPICVTSIGDGAFAQKKSLF